MQLLRVLLEMLDVVKCGVEIERDIDALKLQYALMGMPLEPQCDPRLQSVLPVSSPCLQRMEHKAPSRYHD